jgi:hypothetical protein
VEVHGTEPPDRSRLYDIPIGNPTVTRLATMATDIIRKHDCKIIYSYYLEPNAMAAHPASAWTGVPYLVKHAGSDLDRLLPLDDLKTAYLEVLDPRIAFGLPEHYFHPDGPRMDINGLLAELGPDYIAYADRNRLWTADQTSRRTSRS